ncbi:MAG: tRNA (N6-isopentenyl adenosine(37)-C2)-methylthiotransferase MiaB [Bacteroidales bacterium]
MTKKYYIETYGCQMNVADSEVVAAMIEERDYKISDTPLGADLILVNTCSVRDNAEKRVWGRLAELKSLKKQNKDMILGLIGCMAERIGHELIEQKVVDLVAGPDAYRDIPYLIDQAIDGQEAINIELSTIETYDSITPQRIDKNSISGFVSIMRGCNNFCTYCIVPYTRGRERSRDPHDIISEITDLESKGYKEVTLLGQNVNSYKWQPDGERKPYRFYDLMDEVAVKFKSLRIRYSTSHPKDITNKLLSVMAKHGNICKHIHLPLQAGSNNVLKTMNRKYTSEWYLERIAKIREIMPECSITTDLMCGFTGESDEDHADTLRIMREVGFDTAFMFKYSLRPGTYAHKRLDDDVSEEVKGRRLEEIIALQNEISKERNNNEIGKTFEVLVEGTSKKSDEQLFGRTSQNKVAVFPKGNLSKGDLVNVKVESTTQTTLICTLA